MNAIKKCIIFGVALLLMANGVFYTALADHNNHKEKKKYQKGDRNHSDHDAKRYLAPANNPLYIEECGACHFPYQPELLPSGSWKKITAVLDDHFGEELEINPESENVISGYLIANSAEKSSAKIAVKIMKSLGDRTPIRITEIPYILKKHDEVDPDVFKKKSIGSFSNCRACHTTAEKGIYEDDHVVIPQ